MLDEFNQSKGSEHGFKEGILSWISKAQLLAAKYIDRLPILLGLKAPHAPTTTSVDEIRMWGGGWGGGG